MIVFLAKHGRSGIFVKQLFVSIVNTNFDLVFVYFGLSHQLCVAFLSR